MDAPSNLTEADRQTLRRSILDWRDHHVAEVAPKLERQLHSLFSAIDQELEQASLKNLLVGTKSFGREHIEPLYKEWVEREVEQLIKAAQVDLHRIAMHAVSHEQREESLKDMDDTSSLLDAVAILAALGGAGSIIPFFTSAAIVSAGGVAGFLGITTVSWPVVATGIGVGAVLISTGVVKVATLRSKAIGKYRKILQDFIRK